MAKHRKLTEELYDLRDVMNTQQGRAVLCRLIENANYFGACSANDTNTMLILHGGRSIAVTLVDTIEREFPDQWLTLLRERLERAKVLNSSNTNNEDEADDNPDN